MVETIERLWVLGGYWLNYWGVYDAMLVHLGAEVVVGGNNRAVVGVVPGVVVVVVCVVVLVLVVVVECVGHQHVYIPTPIGLAGNMLPL